MSAQQVYDQEYDGCLCGDDDCPECGGRDCSYCDGEGWGVVGDD